MKTKLLLLLLLANFSIYAQINLVPNGELNTDGGVILNWTISNAVNTYYDYATTQSNAKLSYITASPKMTALVPLKAGVTYTVKYRYKYLSNNYSGDHPISLNISQNGGASTLSSSTFATNNSWTEKVTTFTADSNLSYNLSISTFSFDSANFEVLIDDVQVYVQGTEQFTLIPDVEFEKKLIAIGMDSGATDGKVSTININNLKTLNVSYANITDLTGISDFKGLTSLICSNNKLQNLDISNNTALTSLDCSYNSIKVLDVANNTNLTFLDCTGNALPNLSVSTNTALKYLQAGNNGSRSNTISLLDLSQNTNLLELDVRGLRLTNLDLTKNTALKQLDCGENSIVALDLSANTALEVLLAGNNKLTTIDLSKNKLLKDLVINSNQLTTLDVSSNNALVLLSCDSNKLKSLNLKNGNNSNFLKNHGVGFMTSSGRMGLDYYSSFKTNPDLTCIQVDNITYSQTNWSTIKDSNTYFSSFDCSLTISIPDSKFEDKLIALNIDTDGKNGFVLNSSINTITTLNVSGSSISDLTGIQYFTALKTLDVSGNLISKLDVSKNINLNTLNTSNNPSLLCVQVADLTVAAGWAVTKDAATSLNLDCEIYTLIPDSKFEDYLISLNIDKDGKNGKVRTENISKITDLGVSNKGISDLTGIQDFTALKQFDASYNALTTIDVSKNLALTSLNLSYNQLKELNVSKNTALTKLYADTNKLTAIDISNNTNLTSFFVYGNKLKTLDVSQNTKLLSLLAQDNQLVAVDLSSNLKLEQLMLSRNLLRTLDLSKNTKLYEVLVDNNKLVNFNIKNGNNIGLISPNGGVRFAQNNLTCIQVDDVAYSNTNWSAKKDASASFSTDPCPLVVPYTLIPDSKFEDKLIALGIDKDGKNGKVATMDIVYLTNINLSNSGITNLKGIEDFIGLTSLECNNNQLATIDVSKNTSLTKLNVSDNKLTALPLSTNLLLSNLNCTNNQITTLDVSKNVELTVLSVSFNKLQNLDVSKNIILKEFDVASNDLFSLNLKNGNNANMQRMIFGNFTDNPNLLCIQVDDAAFSNDKWIAKDATATYSTLACPINDKYTLIPDPNFEDALIARGIDTDGKNGKVKTEKISSLVSLNIYQSYKITDLTGIEDFRSLESLTCSNNELTQLTLSKNVKLKSIDVSYNKINSLDVSDNTALEILYCYNNKLTELNTSYNLALKTLNTSNNLLTGINISKNLALKTLDVGSNQITAIDTRSNLALTDLFISNNKLASIDVSKNLGLNSLVLSSNKSLEDVDVSTNIALTRLEAITCSLKTINVSKNKALVSLQVSGNLIETVDVSQNPLLTTLGVNTNQLTNLNLNNSNNKTLAFVSATSNPKLTCIQVDDVDYANTNWSTRKDATATFSASPCPYVISYTLIPDSKFEDKLIALGIDKDGKNGKVATLNILTLTSLNVSNSGITNLSGIEDFSALTSLDCSYNQLTAINVSKNSSLTNLNVSKNKLTALSVLSNTSLTNLNCSNNEIAVLDVSRNTNLTILSASINKLRNLDVSKNKSLKEFDCALNDLFNLNVKNGNNANMQRMIFGNFTENPNLLCIQVDDVSFSTQNWIAKDAKATYSTEVCETNYQYTLIPDINFENLLISKGIDKDGQNGKVRTESISNIISLTVSGPANKITDLTGIQDFVALESLDCSNNNLTVLDLSKNLKLKTLDSRSNKLTSLDFSKNTNLTSLNASDNILTTLDISQNAALTTLYIFNNKFTTVDISKNTALKTFSAYVNQLTSLDLSQNTVLASIDISSNKLTSLDLSKNTSLTTLTVPFNQLTTLDASKNLLLTTITANDNQLTSVDISQNTLLSNLNVFNNKLTILDVSKNSAITIINAASNELTAFNISKNTVLKTIDISNNKIEALDISLNPALTSLKVNSNQLTSLNLRNGKNSLLTNGNVSFISNLKLTCILVDDVNYANTNWSNRKDAIATYNTECTGELVLPANNFAIETKGESCLGENNGEISIVAKTAFDYTATINDKPYTFTNNSLKVAALIPGVYKIKITIPNMIFEQNFNITIAKGATITGKSTITSKKVDVEITEGTAPFTVFVDGTEQFQTNDSNFSIALNEGGLLEVATSKACEGIYSKKIKTTEILGTILSAYPNPTTGVFEIEIPTDKNEVTIELYNFGGQLVSGKKYVIENGTAKLNLENQPSGIYAAKIYLENPEYIKIIKK